MNSAGARCWRFTEAWPQQKAPDEAGAIFNSLLITIKLFQRVDDVVMLVITMLSAIRLAAVFIGRGLIQRLLWTLFRIQPLGSCLRKTS